MAGVSEFIRCRGAEALAEEAAGRITAIAQAAIAEHGYCSWALSGGGTPVPTYRRLAESPWRESLDWPRIHVFFADERWVPHDHADSNYLLAWENLLQRVPIPPENIHAVPYLAPAEQAAASYQQHILAFFSPRPVCFDLITLGMGPDGHTASLFPGMDDCGDKLVAAIHDSPKPPPVRITLTYPLLDQAQHRLFLVTADAGKAALLEEIAGPGPQSKPVGKILGTAERPVVWLLDDAAA